MSRPWYPHYPGDYMRDTGHLSLMEDGAYRRLMDYYYASGKPLPAIAEQLLRICRAFAGDEADAVLSVLRQFFVLRDGAYHNERCDSEIAKAESISDIRRKCAAKTPHKGRSKSPAIVAAKDIAIADTSTTTTTVLHTQGEKLTPDVFVQIVRECRPEFSNLSEMDLKKIIHDAGNNPRIKENVIEFLADAANMVKAPDPATRMLRAYINSTGPRKPQERREPIGRIKVTRGTAEDFKL